jgi:hypothetical protein
MGQPLERGYFGRRGEREHDYGLAGPAGGLSEPDDWRQPGPFTGRGPRGYQRSDARVQEQVCERLWLHGQLDATGITVQVRDGLVALAGTVDSRWAKHEAEDVAWSVPGVVEVDNALKVARRASAAAQPAAMPGGQEPVDRWSGARMGRNYTRPGMEVVDAEGEPLGLVWQMSDTGAWVGRGGRAVFVPFDFVRAVMHGRVYLGVPAGRLAG